MKGDLKLYNSLSAKLEHFEPIHPPFVGMYVCGPTVYNEVHIGNVRTFLSFDLIYRYLLHIGYRVRYVRNITDVGHLTDDSEEDKISKKARLENIEPMEVVQRYTIDFHRTMDLFNALPPSIEPTATGHLMEQIDLIQKIVDAGYGYVSNGSVYFDIEAYSGTNEYGRLSGRKLDELLQNTRDLEGQDDKKNPLDFAIWKKAEPEHIMKWPSPWGQGFPGWHLECSAMSTKYLGDRFDIHGGGMDLKFPHHECEIAQAKAGYGTDPVKYWLHGNMLTFEGRKMAKSEGTGITPAQLLSGDHPLLDKGFSPSAIRFFMLQAHYRSTLDFSNEALKAAEKGFTRMMDAFSKLKDLPVADRSDFKVGELRDRLYEAMNDDFNSPMAISHLFEAVKWINSVHDGKAGITEKDRAGLLELMTVFLFEIFGLQTVPGAASTSEVTDDLIRFILELRKNAKDHKDYATSDRIRDRLQELGIIVKDSKEGATFTIGNA